MMNRDLISSRRPKNAEPEQNAAEGEFVNSKLPVQEYMLPILPTFFLNYHEKVSIVIIQNLNFSKMRFSSTDLESTIFIFSYGVDNFLIRMSPDKAFDLLADGFNYLQLSAVLIIVTGVALYFRNLTHDAKLKKPHSA